MGTVGRPKLLDLFCGAGGCSMGYYDAGFDVVGVDLMPRRDYLFEFIEADAMNRGRPIHCECASGSDDE